MDHPHRRLHTVVGIVVVILAACGANDSTTTPTPTFTTADPASPPASSELVWLTAIPTPIPTPTPTSSPTPNPTPKPASRWSRPHQIGMIRGCLSLTSGIDSASRYHVAAECGGNIHYYVSSDSGRSWTHTVFAHPAHRQDGDPQIAFWGDTVYVAYSQIIPDEGCSGSRGADAGVYFRSRIQPDGAWSSPARIGSPHDMLYSFRVDGDTIHAMVSGYDGYYYETLTGSTLHRYRPPGLGSQLRIGADGRARMVYGADRGLRYAVFTGSGFSISPIAGTTVPSPPSDSTVVLDSTPELAMDANDKAHLVWTRTWEEQAACGRAPANAIGTYYATNASGVWKVARITRAVGETSLQVDQKTGRVHVVMSGKKLRYYTTAGNGRWSGSTVTSVSASSPLLRLDPATGTLLIVYLGGSGGSRIYAMTKP